MFLVKNIFHIDNCTVSLFLPYKYNYGTLICEPIRRQIFILWPKRELTLLLVTNTNRLKLTLSIYSEIVPQNKHTVHFSFKFWFRLHTDFDCIRFSTHRRKFKLHHYEKPQAELFIKIKQLIVVKFLWF